MTVEKWGVLELSFNGKADGNPFKDYEISGRFVGGREDVTVGGFYDGDGVYKVRFMPSYEGEYSYTVSGSFCDEEYSGEFCVTPAKEGNHGPVKVANKYHFAYADGTPYFCVGTTCYVWNLQSDELIEKTLASLKTLPFNKIRFCVFPKHYDYNLHEPRSYPYIGTPVDSSGLTSETFWNYNNRSNGNNWDFERFNPKHFEHIEKCISALMDLGIEADIILFHPYDRWGFSCMKPEHDDMYLKYVVARFSAFRNVWWSFANEFDLMKDKSHEDWQRFASVVMENDRFDHLRSIHNCIGFYDHSEPWVTHCSLQRQDMYRTTEYTNEHRNKYGKPVVWDEIGYEGNIQHGWGNLPAVELLRRFWEAFCRGGYLGHGETYYSDDSILWWSHGGVLKGDAAPRCEFIAKIASEVPGGYLKFSQQCWDAACGIPEDDEVYEKTGFRLIYLGLLQPCFKEYYYDNENEYAVDVIDTWNMTVEHKGTFKGKIRIELPGKPFMAIRIYKV